MLRELAGTSHKKIGNMISVLDGGDMHHLACRTLCRMMAVYGWHSLEGVRATAQEASTRVWFHIFSGPEQGLAGPSPLPQQFVVSQPREKFFACIM